MQFLVFSLFNLHNVCRESKSIVFRWRRTDRRMRTWRSSLDHTSQCSQARWASVTCLSSQITCPGATALCSTCPDTCLWIRGARAHCRGHVTTTWTPAWTPQMATWGMTTTTRREASSPCPDTRPGPGPGTRTGSEIGEDIFYKLTNCNNIILTTQRGPCKNIQKWNERWIKLWEC